MLELARQGAVVVKSFDTDQLPDLLNRRPAGIHTCTITVPGMFLKPGSYTAGVGLGIARQRTLDKIENAATFDIVTQSMSDSYKGFAPNQPGVVIFPGKWHQND